MAKIKPPAPETVHNQDLGGVKVTIQLHSEKKGEEVIISLPYSCAWKGRLINTAQRFYTDERGRVIVMLPPSDELVALNGISRTPGPVSYKLKCFPIGVIAFQVPNVAEWTLGQEKE